MMKDIAERLRGLRDSIDLSTAEMAEQTGIDAVSYEKYESGDVDIPMNYICQVAKKFNVDVYEIDLTPVIYMFETGQYDYQFINNKQEVICSGIIQFNGYNSNIIEYEFEQNVIQYNPDQN